MKSVGFTQREELREECLGTVIPGIYCTSVGIKPLFCLSEEGKRKQTESDCILSDSLDDKSTAEFQELLEMGTSILVGLATEWAGLHHRDQTRLDLKISRFSVDSWPDWDIISRRTREFMERLLGH